MELILLFIIFAVAAVYFFLSEAKSLREDLRDQEHLDDLRKLAKSGYVIDENGLTTCMVCGGYCGQCGSTKGHGLTLEEYRQKFWS